MIHLASANLSDTTIAPSTLPTRRTMARLRPDQTTTSLDAMDNVEELKKEYELLVTVMCKALNEPKRLLILTLLGERPRTVSDLVEEIGSPQANVSQHLAILRDRGLVKATREGTSVTYSLSHQQILTAIATLREVMHDELDQKRRLLSPDQDPTTAKEAS